MCKLVLKGPVEVELKDLSTLKSQARGNKFDGLKRIFDEKKVFQNATAIGKGMNLGMVLKGGAAAS